MKIGFVVKNLAASQLAYFLIDSLNRCCENNYEDNYVVFSQNKASKMKPNNFAMLNSSELWGFDGVLVATCVATAMEVLKSVSPAKKYFYVWDLEWCRSHLMGLEQRRDYVQTVRAFSHPSMNLIVRSPSHAAAIKNYCNKPVCGIVDDFNITELKQVITQ